jgi:hypothetical protein
VIATKPQSSDVGSAVSGSRRWLILGMLILAAGLGIGYLTGSAWPWKKLARHEALTDLTVMPDDARPLKPGPWGNLEYLPMSIEPPEEYLAPRSLEETDRRWSFEGFTPDQLSALFKSVDGTAAQMSELLDASKWQQNGGTIVVDASKELIVSLSPRARKQIYGALTTNPSSLFTLLRCSFPIAGFDKYFAESGLPDETVALVKKLSFPHGRLLFFYDVRLVLDTLPAYKQKIRLLKTLLRKPTLLLRLHITPDSDMDSLAHYWIKAGWGVDLRPMLDSLAKLPRGARIGIVNVLPPIPSAQIYTFPFPSLKPEELRKDCHWTSFNFFRDVPRAPFFKGQEILDLLEADYYQVVSDPRYGDIGMLKKPNGDMIHSCVFIADNIVYTKNSASATEPFILMRDSDMLDIFSAQIPEGQTLGVQWYRNKHY